MTIFPIKYCKSLQAEHNALVYAEIGLKPIHLSQDLTGGTFWQQKSIVRYLQRNKDLAIVNNYRKFEEIIFTNNKDMSV